MGKRQPRRVGDVQIQILRRPCQRQSRQETFPAGVDEVSHLVFEQGRLQSITVGEFESHITQATDRMERSPATPSLPFARMAFPGQSINVDEPYWRRHFSLIASRCLENAKVVPLAS